MPSNYRGITLTCILSKVLERIVYDQITTYLRERNILSESQYGFRTGHSCADLLTVAIDDWLLAQDRKMHTAIVFIDLILFRAGGGGHIVPPPPPQVNFRKYLKNALSYRVETF